MLEILGHQVNVGRVSVHEYKSSFKNTKQSALGNSSDCCFEYVFPGTVIWHVSHVLSLVFNYHKY